MVPFVLRLIARCFSRVKLVFREGNAKREASTGSASLLHLLLYILQQPSIITLAINDSANLYCAILNYKKYKVAFYY